MRKALKLASVCAVSLLAATTVGFFGCDEIENYEQYANASLYSVGSASFTAEQVKKIEVDWVEGSIEIAQSSDTVSVVEDEGVSTEAERMRYYLDGDVLKIKYCQSGFRGDIRAENKNLRISLPKTTSLDVDSTTAVVTVDAIELPKFCMQSVSGNLTVQRLLCAEMELETVSGTTTVGELVAESFSLETVSGNFSAERLSVDFLDAETVSARLAFGVQKALTAEIESTSGDIVFVLSEKLGATIRLETATGKFNCEKEYVQTGGRYDVAGAEGSLKCDLVVDVFSGNLYIR